jgi:glycosyltransferase involved in cell wall biosynthesis
MTSLPLVTIGITCYNAADSIQRAISSALAQNYANFEVLIVDDASTDESCNVIKELISTRENSRLIQREKNGGPAAARNMILKDANGEFVAFFDDDDESYPERIAEQLKTITDYERLHGAQFVMCYASGERMYANGYKKELAAIGSQGEEVPNGPALADYLLFYKRKSHWFYGSGTPSCSLMARKGVLSGVGGFDENLKRVEDVDLAIRLALMGTHFIGTKRPLFRQYSTVANDKSFEKNLQSEIAIAQNNKDYLLSINRFYYAMHWPKLRYHHFQRNYAAFLYELIFLLIRYPHAVTSHLLSTGPKRILHEAQMNIKINCDGDDCKTR